MCAKRMTVDQFKNDPTRIWDPDNNRFRLRTAADEQGSDNDMGGRAAEPKRDGPATLGPKGKDTKSLADSPIPLRVTIIREYTGQSVEYDDDNFNGGCKGLRDAVAALLGRSGDGKKDGLSFAYAQVRGETTETRIEIEEE